MNAIDLFKTGSILIILFFVENSCSTTRKQAVLCPELPGNNRNKNVILKSEGHYKKNFVFAHREGKTRKNEGNGISLFNKYQDKHPVATKRADIKTGNIISTDLNKIYGLNKIDFKNNLFASSDNSNISVLNTTLSVNSGKNELAEIDHNEVNNRMNGDRGNPVNSISKSDITIIKYPDALEKSSIAPNKITFQADSKPQKVEPFGVIGFIFSLVHIGTYLWTIIGLLDFWFLIIPCGLLALVLGAVSLARIKKHPDRFKGKVFAVISFIIGLVFCTLLILFLVVLLTGGFHLNLNI